MASGLSEEYDDDDGELSPPKEGNALLPLLSAAKLSDSLMLETENWRRRQSEEAWMSRLDEGAATATRVRCWRRDLLTMEVSALCIVVSNMCELENGVSLLLDFRNFAHSAMLGAKAIDFS